MLPATQVMLFLRHGRIPGFPHLFTTFLSCSRCHSRPVNCAHALPLYCVWCYALPDPCASIAATTTSPRCLRTVLCNSRSYNSRTLAGVTILLERPQLIEWHMYMYGRQSPSLKQLLMPSQKNQQDVRVQKNIKQAKQKHYFDRHVGALPNLQAGDTVRILPKANSKNWEKAQVQEKVNIRSYKVITENGREFRRNRKHIRSTQERYIPPSEPHAPTQEQIPDKQNSHAVKANTHTEQQNVNIHIPTRYSTREHKPPSYLKDYVT